MAYPYKKMTSEDFDYIRSVTASDDFGWFPADKGGC